MFPSSLVIRDENDRSYVALLYEENKEKLFYIANKILNHQQDAEDCVHDVIESLIDYLQVYMESEEEHQKNILGRMCRNIAIDKYRKNKRRNQFEYYPDDDSMFEFVDEESDVSKIVIREENRNRLIELIDSLDSIHSDILFWRYFMNMSISHIAKMLALTETAVRMRLSRARKKLLDTKGDELYEIWKS